MEDSYKNILDHILYLEKEYIVVKGISDVKDGRLKNIKQEDLSYIFGHANPEQLLDILQNSLFFEAGVSGEYEFTVILSHNKETYAWGDPIQPYDIGYLDFKFLRTFKQRDRSKKLNNILN